MWSGHPLSYADPGLSKAFYQELFDALDANGIVQAGIELGNEMNWAASVKHISKTCQSGMSH